MVRITGLLMIAVLTLVCGVSLGQDTANRIRPEPIPGRVAWFDLATTNLTRSKEFFGKLLGWEYSPSPETSDALEILATGVTIGALRTTEEKRASQGIVYFEVDDISAICSEVKKLGGAVSPGYPRDIADRSGSTAIIADPSGCIVGLYSRYPIERYPHLISLPQKIPKQGCVPDEATAIKIAVAVWEPVYGKTVINKERPFRAELVRDVWHVWRRFPRLKVRERRSRSQPRGVEPPPAEEPKGGSLELHIRKRDGCILWLQNSGPN